MGRFLLIKNKKGQAWGMDLIIAVVIFSVALSAIYFYSINDNRSNQENTDTLFYDGGKISDSILSEGSPSNWESGNVLQIGILEDGKISSDKLEKFYNLDYERSRSIFNTRHDYYFFLRDPMLIGGLEVDGFGKPGVDRNTVSAKSLIKITRIVVYNNRIMPAYLYVFDNE